MKKKVKLILIIVAVIAIVGASIYSYIQPLALETETLFLSTGEISFTESGLVINRGEISIYPLAVGEVTSIPVSKGATVKKGDVLATLDSSAIEYELARLKSTLVAYEAQKDGAIIEIDNGVDSLIANRSNLYAQLKVLEAQSTMDNQLSIQEGVVEQAKMTWDRGLEELEKYKLMYDEGIVSSSELKDLEMMVSTYEIGYQQSIDQLASIQSSGLGGDYYRAMKSSLNAQISGINKALERDGATATKAYYEAMVEATKAGVDAMENQVKNYTITSPVDGTIDQINILNVNVISNLTPAFVIQGSDAMEIEVYVNTRDIAEVTTGEKVTLILDRRSGDIELSGTVKSIAANASATISSLGVEERKVLVTITPDTTTDLAAGYDIDVKFVVFGENNKIIVPNSAIFQIEEKDYVMVIRDKKVVEVGITLGYELTGETIVEEGLNEGDVLITDLDAKGLKAGINAVSSNE